MFPFQQPLNSEVLDEIFRSDLCLEEKLARHMAQVFGREVGFVWVELATQLILGADFDVHQDTPFTVPGFEELNRGEPTTMRQQLHNLGLDRYTGKYLVPVKDMYPGTPRQYIPTSKASLEQKLKWHCFLYRPALRVTSVNTLIQAVWLDAYGFDLDETMIQLPSGCTYFGKPEMSVGAVIREFKLEPYLLQTEDNEYRRANS